MVRCRGGWVGVGAWLWVGGCRWVGVGVGR